MKPKEFNKKLVLNKRTIAHLGKKEMNEVHGGYSPKCVPEATIDCSAACSPISCPTNNTNLGGACCCGGDTTIEIC